MMLRLLGLVVVSSLLSAHGMEDKLISWADRSTNLAWLATEPLASITPTIMQSAAPKFGKCMAAVLRISKALRQAHDAGEDEDLDIQKLEEIATNASASISPESREECDDSCKLEMYEDALAQRIELWHSVGMILDPQAKPLPTTPTSKALDFFKYGLREWLNMTEARQAAFTSSCDCEEGLLNLYCWRRSVKTAGWPEALFEMDAELQAVLVGIEQDQRVSQNQPEKLNHGQHNFLQKWKLAEFKKYAREAIDDGQKRRAAGVLEKLQDLIASPEGQALKASIMLAKAIAATAAVGVYATCSLLKTGYNFAKAMNGLAGESGRTLCHSMQQKLDRSSSTSSTPVQTPGRFRRAGATLEPSA